MADAAHPRWTGPFDWSRCAFRRSCPRPQVHDLVRAGAHFATSILLTLSAADDREEEASGGTIQNGATLAALLALRHVLLTSGAPLTPDLRITVQLSKPSRCPKA